MYPPFILITTLWKKSAHFTRKDTEAKWQALLWVKLNKVCLMPKALFLSTSTDWNYLYLTLLQASGSCHSKWKRGRMTLEVTTEEQMLEWWCGRQKAKMAPEILLVDTSCRIPSPWVITELVHNGMSLWWLDYIIWHYMSKVKGFCRSVEFALISWVLKDGGCLI